MGSDESPRATRPTSSSRSQSADENVDDAANGQASPRAPRSRRLRAWIIGLVIAAVGAALTDAATGGISAGLKLAWDAVVGNSEPPPLTVSAHLQHSRRSQFVLQKPVSALLPLPRDTSDATRLRWAERNGGVDASTTAVRVVVQGRSTASVILSDLTIDVVTRRPPPTGTLVQPEGAGGISVRYFEVDLDQPAPTPELGTQNEPRPGERPLDFPYKVSLTDPEVFVLYANTQRCDCRWTATLHWESGGKSGTTVIRNGEQPFRTAAPVAARDVVAPATDGRLRRVKRNF